MCGAVLGMRRGSRLHRALVRERQEAAEANAFTFDLSKGVDLLIVDVTGASRRECRALEAEVAGRSICCSVRASPAAEVERALALIETDFRFAAIRIRARGQTLTVRHVLR